MGKQWRDGKGGYSQPQSPVQYWQGAWKNRQWKQHGTAPWKAGQEDQSWLWTSSSASGTAPPSFPRYDSKDPQLVVVAEKKAEEPGIVQTMQRAVTNARKAETRRRKLQSDLEAKRRCWTGFQQELKATYLKEQQRFQTDVLKLQEEIREAKLQEDAAKQHLVPHGDSGMEEIFPGMDRSRGLGCYWAYGARWRESATWRYWIEQRPRWYLFDASGLYGRQHPKSWNDGGFGAAESLAGHQRKVRRASRHPCSERNRTRPASSTCSSANSGTCYAGAGKPAEYACGKGGLSSCTKPRSGQVGKSGSLSVCWGYDTIRPRHVWPRETSCGDCICGGEHQWATLVPFYVAHFEKVSQHSGVSREATHQAGHEEASGKDISERAFSGRQAGEVERTLGTSGCADPVWQCTSLGGWTHGPGDIPGPERIDTCSFATAIRDLRRRGFCWRYLGCGPGVLGLGCFDGRRQQTARDGLTCPQVCLTSSGEVSCLQDDPDNLQRLWQRGGQLSGAVQLTDTGHVPSEPLHISFAGVNHSQELDRSFWGAVSSMVNCFLCGHGTSDEASELIVSIRLLVWLLEPFNLGEVSHICCEKVDFPLWDLCLTQSCESCKLTVRVRKQAWVWVQDQLVRCICTLDGPVDLSLWGLQWMGQWQSAFCGVVFPPWWNDGLLSTSSVRADGLSLLKFCSTSVAGSQPLASCTSYPSGAILGCRSVDSWRCMDDFDAFLLLIREDGPSRLAGSTLALQRQILLPVVSVFFNVFLSLPSLLYFWIDRLPVHQLVLVLGSTSNNSAVMPAGRMQNGSLDQASSRRRPAILPGIECLQDTLESLLDAASFRFLSCLLSLLVQFGAGLAGFCRSMCAISLCYLFRLLLFSCSLEGGVNNCDNLLWAARSSVEAVPWQLGTGLCAFSPRLQGGAFSSRKSQVGRRYSADLLFLLILVSALISPTRAANSRSQPTNPTEFPTVPAFRDEEAVDRGLLMDPDIAQDWEPQPWVLNPPPPVYVTRAYKLIGFGRPPEYSSSTTTQTATAQQCLELLAPDVEASRSGGSGTLQFLRGPAVEDELQAQWMPDWVNNALGRLVVIDASLLGFTPFQTFIQDGIISYQRVHRLMPELDGSEFFIFIPSQDNDPLAFEGYPSR